MRIDAIGPPRGAERTAKAQIIRPERSQRGDMFQTQRSGEARHQAKLTRSRDELAEPLHRQVIRQCSMGLAGGIEHGSGKT